MTCPGCRVPAARPSAPEPGRPGAGGRSRARAGLPEPRCRVRRTGTTRSGRAPAPGRRSRRRPRSRRAARRPGSTPGRGTPITSPPASRRAVPRTGPSSGPPRGRGHRRLPGRGARPRPGSPRSAGQPERDRLPCEPARGATRPQGYAYPYGGPDDPPPRPGTARRRAARHVRAARRRRSPRTAEPRRRRPAAADGAGALAARRPPSPADGAGGGRTGTGRRRDPATRLPAVPTPTAYAGRGPGPAASRPGAVGSGPVGPGTAGPSRRARPRRSAPRLGPRRRDRVPATAPRGTRTVPPRPRAAPPRRPRTPQDAPGTAPPADRSARPAPGAAGTSGQPRGPRRPGPATPLAAERARQARMAVVGAVTERWAPEQAGPVHENWQLAAARRPRHRPVGARRAALPGRPGACPVPRGERRRAGAAGLRRAARLRRGVRPAAARSSSRCCVRTPPSGPTSRSCAAGCARSCGPRPSPRPGSACVPLPAADPAPAARRTPPGRAGAQAPGRADRDRPHGRHKRRRRSRGARSRAGPCSSAILLVAAPAAVAYAMLFMPEAGRAVPQARAGDGPRRDRRARRRQPRREPEPQPRPPPSRRPTGAPRRATPDVRARRVPETPTGAPAPPRLHPPQGPGGLPGRRRQTAGSAARSTRRGQVRVHRRALRADRRPRPGHRAGRRPIRWCYQRDKEPRAAAVPRLHLGHRDRRCRPIEVGRQTMAEGQFTWTGRDGPRACSSAISSIALDGQYHVVQVRGPEDERDKVTRSYEQATASYRSPADRPDGWPDGHLTPVAGHGRYASQCGLLAARAVPVLPAALRNLARSARAAGHVESA